MYALLKYLATLLHIYKRSARLNTIIIILLATMTDNHVPILFKHIHSNLFRFKYILIVQATNL